MIPELSKWTAAEWSALGNMLLGIGALATGGWAIFNYFKTRRNEASKWLNALFSEFYVKGTFGRIRVLFEYHYRDMLGSLIERRITDRQLAVSDDEIQLLFELDTLLNYFEHVLYLEEGRHLRKYDRQALLEYWFNLMSDPFCGGLRRYVVKFGFERIARALHCSQKEYVALYGSLMLDIGGMEEAGVGDKLRYKGSCTIPGSIYSLGAYPGLVLDDNSVQAELYEIKDMSVFRALDSFERFDPSHRDTSLFVRSCIRLLKPKNIDAWVYVYNQDVSVAERIASGDWREHIRDKKQ